MPFHCGVTSGGRWRGLNIYEGTFPFYFADPHDREIKSDSYCDARRRPLNARMESDGANVCPSDVWAAQCGSRLGIAKAIQSERSPLMLCRLALREKSSECFLRLIGPYSFGED